MAGDWIPIETTTPRKSEMLKLAKITGLPVCHVLGIMVSFWCWVSDESVDGLVDADVDALSSLFGTEPKFWRAVLQVGWLKERDKDAQLVVPNFDHWLSNGAKSRLRKTRRQGRYRKSETVGGTQASTRPSTKRHQRREEKSKDRSTYLSLAQKIYEAYPRHIGKAKALPAIEKAIEVITDRGDLMKKEAAAWLLARVQKFADSPAGKRGTFTPHPATWMNGGRYDDNDAEWQRQDGDGQVSPARVRGTDPSDAQLTIHRPTD